MHANKREELDKVYSGDIAAAIGFKFTSTGDTICDEQHPVILESMEFPEPVIELAIEPKTKAPRVNLVNLLQNWLKRILHSVLILIRNWTDNHRRNGRASPEIIVDSLLREFKVRELTYVAASGCLQWSIY